MSHLPSLIDEIHYFRIPVNELEDYFSRNGQLEFAVGFTSPNIQLLREKLIEHGVEVDDMKEEDGHFFFHFFDPNGNKLQAHW